MHGSALIIVAVVCTVDRPAPLHASAAEDDGVGEDEGEDDGGDDSAPAPAGKHAAEQVPALSEAERRERRQQLAALLQPGETALDGLRRLGGLQVRVMDPMQGRVGSRAQLKPWHGDIYARARCQSIHRITSA